MVNKFSDCDSKLAPALNRRNTVARCTDIANDVKRKNLICHQNGDQHAIWDDHISGADAATDHEFSSLMERVSDLNRKDSDASNLEDKTSSLTRGSQSRKSLPAGALKSYMRGTKASIMKTRESSPSQVLEETSPKNSPAPNRKVKTSTENIHSNAK
ncbi:hypothetical protein SK128_000882, partial [Halocaridina rubra]